MDLYIFKLTDYTDVVAFASTPDSHLLPRGNSEHGWRLFRQFVEGETLPTRVPMDTITEQISRYGYCIVHGTAEDRQAQRTDD